MERTVDQNGFTDQSSIPGQKGNLQYQFSNNQGNSPMNSNTYFNNGINKGNSINGTSQTLNYPKPQFQNQNPLRYGSVSFSNTSIDNGFRR
jgi:hypothetical protein